MSNIRRPEVLPLLSRAAETIGQTLLSGGITAEVVISEIADLFRSKLQLSVQPSLKIGTEEEKMGSIGERLLAPEVLAALLPKIKSRFDAHPKRHKGVNWIHVQRCLEADPTLFWSLNEMETRGHEPDVYREDDTAYYFGTFSKESPKSARNIVYNAEAQAWLAKYRPNDVYNGNAEDIAASMGIELMPGDHYKSLENICKFDSNTKSWLKTEKTNTGSGQTAYALCGIGSSLPHMEVDEYIHTPGPAITRVLEYFGIRKARHHLLSIISSTHEQKLGFRASLKVPKLQRS